MQYATCYAKAVGRLAHLRVIKTGDKLRLLMGEKPNSPRVALCGVLTAWDGEAVKANTKGQIKSLDVCEFCREIIAAERDPANAIDPQVDRASELRRRG